VIRPSHAGSSGIPRSHGFTFPSGYQRILLSKDIRHIAASMLAELTEQLLRSPD